MISKKEIDHAIGNKYLRLLAAVGLPMTMFALCRLDGNFIHFLIWGISTFYVLWFCGVYVCKLSKDFSKPDRIRSDDDFDEPFFWDFNGSGTRLVDISGNPLIKYKFFCIMYMPLIPMGCYSYEDDGFYDSKCCGYCKWSLIEILGIYMKWWGGCIFILLIVDLILGLLCM